MIKSLFELPFYHYEISDWATKKQKISDFVSKLDFSKTNYFENLEPQKTTFYKNFDKSFLECFLLKELVPFSNESGLRFKITDVWVQSYDSNEFHDLHSHGFVGYSGVLYVNFDKQKHLSTVFLNPLHSFLSQQNKIFKEVEVNEGDIIIFESSILHKSPPNTSNLNRTVIAFNLKTIQENETVFVDKNFYY